MTDSPQAETVNIEDVLRALHYAQQPHVSEVTNVSDQEHLERVLNAYIDQRIAAAMLVVK